MSTDRAADPAVLILTQCYPPTLGGIEAYVGGLAAAAAEKGCAVDVFADGGSETRDYDAAQSASADGAGPRMRRFGGLKPLRRRLKAIATASRLTQRPPTHVIADSWKSLELIGAGALERSKARVLCLAHGMEFPDPDTTDERRAARIAAAYGKADRVLANSAYTAALAQPFAAQDDQISVALPPIPPQHAPTEAARGALRARLRALLGPSDGPLIATLCRLEPRKGVDRLIQALAALRAAHPTARLAAAGDGEDKLRLQGLAEAHGVADRVAFLGRIDEAEKAAFFAEAEVFAMPARREGRSVEGFGLVYLEAAWHGAPSLAGRDGGAPDAVKADETGLLCDGADAGSVAEALATLLSAPQRRAQMGRAAAAWARENLWSVRIADYLG